MKNESKLSCKSNMALGFIPLIATMLLSVLISVYNAVYAGAGIGLLLSTIYFTRHKTRVTHFILYASTTVMIAFSIFMLVIRVRNGWFFDLLPLFLEITITLPLLILYLNRKKFSSALLRNEDGYDMKEQVRVVTLTISCAGVFLVLAAIHLAFILLGLLAIGSFDNQVMWFLLHIMPVLIFMVSILIGYMEVRVLRTINAPEFVPIVTAAGGVIGKVNKDQLEAEYKTSHTYPVIRIAVISHNMLFLAKRSQQRLFGKGKIDTPLETCLLFGEDIKHGIERLLRETFPGDWQKLEPHFSIKYQFKNDETNRLVYLFVLDLGVDDIILCDPKFESGKLWTFQQIDSNLDQEYFCEMFENEYEHLKGVIETRGKYKEV